MGGFASTHPPKWLKRVTVCFYHLACALDSVAGKKASGRHHNAVQIQVVELTEPGGENECRQSDECHDDSRKVKEERIQLSLIHI